MNTPLSTQVAQINKAIKDHDFAAATELLLQWPEPQNREAALAHVMREWGKESALAATFAKLLTGKERDIALASAAVGRAQSNLVGAGLAMRYALEMTPGQDRDRAVADVLLALGRRADNPHGALLTAMQIMQAALTQADAHAAKDGMRTRRPAPESTHSVERLLAQLPEGTIRQHGRAVAERERKKRIACAAASGHDYRSRPPHAGKAMLAHHSAFCLRVADGELRLPAA